MDQVPTPSDVHLGRKVDADRLVRAVLLSGFGVLIIKLLATGELSRYMNTALNPVNAAAGVVMLVMGGLEWRSAWRGVPSARGMDAPAGAWGERVLTYVLVATTLAIGLLIAPRTLDSAALAGEDLANYLLAFGPAAASGQQQAAIIQPLRPIDDVPELLSYLSRAGAGGLGQHVRVTGLVARSGGLRQDEFPLLRFMIVHCVADARPIGILVTGVAAPPDVDHWVEVEGTISVRDRSGTRFLAIEATAVRPAKEPADPYLHPF